MMTRQHIIGYLVGVITTVLLLVYIYPNINEPKYIQVPCNDSILEADTITVKASYYNNTRNQCDDSPNRTANNTLITKKHDKKAVALSRDLFKKFNMGDSLTVVSPKHLAGKYLIFDTMNKRWKNKVDFFTFSRLDVDSVVILL